MHRFVSSAVRSWSPLLVLLLVGCGEEDTGKHDTGTGGTTDTGSGGSDTCVFYADADGDGYGDATSSAEAPCDEVPSGMVDDDTDCDDTDSSVNPGATETCNGVDDDCDDLVDDDDADITGTSTWYPDDDADGYGDEEDSVEACEAPDGYTDATGDCDDTDSSVNPGATETCNELDDDCDGEVDESPASCTTSPSDDGSIRSDLYGSDTGAVSAYSGTCDVSAGYQPFEDHCYLAVEDSSTSWADARATCVAAGGYLVAVGSMAENDFVNTIHNRFFLGACEDPDEEGLYLWVSGEEWDFDNWDEGRPDDKNGDEEVVVIGQDGTWNDVLTDQTRNGYVCEFGSVDEVTGVTLDDCAGGDFTIAGDVDGDGYDDVACVTAAGGAVAVFHGSSGGLSSSASTVIGAGLGSDTRIDGAGDVDNDGYDDLVAGDRDYDGGAGRFLVYMGSASGLDSTAAAELAGSDGQALGAEVSGIGDVDGDGYHDVAVTVVGVSAPVVEVFSGSSGGIDTGTAVVLDTDYHVDSTGSYYFDDVTGESLHGGGDLDGDGYADLVVGYPTWDTEYGAFAIYYGAAGAISDEPEYIYNPYPGYVSTWCYGPPYMSWSLRNDADFDGDGYDDVAASAPYDLCDGYIYVWYGSSSGVGDSEWTEIYGYSVGVYDIGFTQATGDFDGDGVEDLAFGGTTAGWVPGDAGRWVVSSSSSEDWEYPTAISGATGSPAEVADRGDIDGDGRDDLVVSDGSSVEVYLGGSDF